MQASLRTLLLATVVFAGTASSLLAGIEHIQTIRRECLSQVAYPQPQCDCIAERAAGDLSDNQQAYVAAQMSGKLSDIAQLQGAMTPEEVAATDAFMGSIAETCS